MSHAIANGTDANGSDHSAVGLFYTAQCTTNIFLFRT